MSRLAGCSGARCHDGLGAVVRLKRRSSGCSTTEDGEVIAPAELRDAAVEGAIPARNVGIVHPLEPDFGLRPATLCVLAGLVVHDAARSEEETAPIHFVESTAVVRQSGDERSVHEERDHDRNARAER